MGASVARSCGWAYGDLMRLGLVLSAVCACVLVAAAPPTAVGAKRKTPSCKGSKVPVTVGKKRTCQPLAKVFPKPKAIDIRLAYLEQALRFDPAKTVPTKRRNRVRTLQSGFGAAGKRAQKKLLKLAPKLLAFIDRKGGARSSSFGPGPALASAGCEPGPAGPTGHTDGASIGTLGENGGYVDAPIGGGLQGESHLRLLRRRQLLQPSRLSRPPMAASTATEAASFGRRSRSAMAIGSSRATAASSKRNPRSTARSAPTRN